MKIIGITGGIGTGKSTVLNILEKEYGAFIVETDKLAHQLMSPGEEAYQSTVETFGKDILCDDNTIDRGKLGSIVFNNKDMLCELNKIVHPAVKKYILEDIELKNKQGCVEYYVIEAALLIEDGYKAICDEIWYIYASQEVRIQRLIEGRGKDAEKWLQVIANQSSEDYYRRCCDVTIDNGDSIEKTFVTIKELLKK
ncbi:MAG: dephospho-CoA kinase [Lachnospiraceae bacterium]|nr:dephospho-CoA kinase [Lachnospiraceae bacterium]